MKKINNMQYLAGFLMMLMFATPVLGAVDAGVIIDDTGIMPNQWTYTFKRMGESLRMGLTFNQQTKAELQYEYSMKRLGEAKYMEQIGEEAQAISLMNQYQNQYQEMEQTMTQLRNKGEDVSSLENQIQAQDQIREQAEEQVKSCVGSCGGNGQ